MKEVATEQPEVQPWDIIGENQAILCLLCMWSGTHTCTQNKWHDKTLKIVNIWDQRYLNMWYKVGLVYLTSGEVNVANSW